MSKNSIVTEEDLEEMKAEVMKQLTFAKKVNAKTKDLEKQLMILTLAHVGLLTE